MNPTDEELLAAWNADVAEHGDSVPMHGETDLEFWMAAASTTTEEERRVLGFWQPGDERRIGMVRDRLGGWDAVWRAVLTDEGFEPQFVSETKWWNAAVGLAVVRHGDDYVLRAGGRSIPLRSPADLRVRKKAAEILFGEGTR